MTKHVSWWVFSLLLVYLQSGITWAQTCTDTWKAIPNTQGTQGRLNGAATTQLECRTTCYADLTCVAYDWDPDAAFKCWLHNTHNTQSNTGTTHYQLEKTCGTGTACTFLYQGQYTLDGTFTTIPGVGSETECFLQCTYTSGCVTAVHNSATNLCTYVSTATASSNRRQVEGNRNFEKLSDTCTTTTTSTTTTSTTTTPTTTTTTTTPTTTSTTTTTTTTTTPTTTTTTTTTSSPTTSTTTTTSPTTSTTTTTSPTTSTTTTTSPTTSTTTTTSPTTSTTTTTSPTTTTATTPSTATPTVSSTTTNGCNPGMYPVWTKTENFHALVGVPQPAITTVADCQAACISNVNCRGIDFVRTAGVAFKCWIHQTDQSSRITPQTGTDFYDLTMRCGMTTTPACTITWSVTQNTHGINGSAVQNVFDVNGCRAVCLNTPGCLSIDTDLNPNVIFCYIFKNGNAVPTLETLANVNHHVLLSSCATTSSVAPTTTTPAPTTTNRIVTTRLATTTPPPASTSTQAPTTSSGQPITTTTRVLGTTTNCFPVWEIADNTGASDGQRQASVTSESDCLALCAANPSCVGVDIDSIGSSLCWHHINVIGTTRNANNIKLFKLVNRCGTTQPPTISTTVLPATTSSGPIISTTPPPVASTTPPPIASTTPPPIASTTPPPIVSSATTSRTIGPGTTTTACIQGFTAFNNTGIDQGIRQVNVSSVQQCENGCLNDAKCYGFDVQTVNNQVQCWHHILNANGEQLAPVFKNGVMLYMKGCACTPTFEQIPAHFPNGIPKVVDTDKACQDLCVMEPTCLGIDIDNAISATARCWLHTVAANLESTRARGPTAGGYHFRLRRCQTTTVPPPAITTTGPTFEPISVCQMYELVDHNDNGGSNIGKMTKTECMNKCGEDDKCVAADYNPSTTECYTHKVRNNVGRSDCCIRFEKLCNQTNCTDSMTEYANSRSVESGVTLPTTTANSQGTCIRACYEDAQCTGVQFNNVANQCTKFTGSLGTPITDSVYTTFIRNRCVKTFTKTTTVPPPTTTASPGTCIADIAFLIDSSGSVNEDKLPGQILNNFDIAKNAIVDVVNTLNIGETTSKVALIPFSTSSSIYMKFSSSRDQISKNISSIPYPEGKTNIPQALLRANEVFSEANGDRQTAQNIVVLIVDGVTSNDFIGNLNSSIDVLRQTPMSILVVAVTYKVNFAELERITGRNMLENIITFTNFVTLDSTYIADSLKRICNGEVVREVTPALTRPTTPATIRP